MTRFVSSLTVPFAAAILLSASSAVAMPPAPATFCEVYADAPACAAGAAQCTTCHAVPPALNSYGTQLSSVLLPDEARPLTESQFTSALPGALAEIEALDADDDGFSNLDEFIAGADPSSPSNVPQMVEGECSAAGFRPAGLDVCAYDPVYVFKKIRIDFCGIAPTYDEMQAFIAEPSPDALTETLDECLDSEFWRAKDGVLWNLANSKIKPIQAIKSGADAGPIPLADYDDDYNFFVYVNSDDRDARDMLTAQYFVERSDGETTEYAEWNRTPIADINERGYLRAQAVIGGRRAGMITHRWFLMSNTMFTGIPRTTAAQAYRSYLGFDISRLEGLDPVEGEPVDYDNKGVTRQECAICHSTLDPLTYPFASYEGIGGGAEIGDVIPFVYAPGRVARFTGVDGESVADTPQAGVIFGEEVADLREWSEVAANSDAFAQSLAGDFWKLLLGHDPTPSELEEFEGVWRRFMEEHEYRTEKMLHDLIKTEAYGVP